ncbi:hypothetical protein HK104_009087 [Borealophlyctis nickersoniae]|nr:hypothetical protein HK104_009087 [Borealophlyctis nickersoniae]
MADGSAYIVEFYANWCGYCQRFATEYEEFAESVDKELEGLKVARVDVDDNPGLTARFMISR